MKINCKNNIQKKEGYSCKNQVDHIRNSDVKKFPSETVKVRNLKSVSKTYSASQSKKSIYTYTIPSYRLFCVTFLDVPFSFSFDSSRDEFCGILTRRHQKWTYSFIFHQEILITFTTNNNWLYVRTP